MQGEIEINIPDDDKGEDTTTHNKRAREHSRDSIEERNEAEERRTQQLWERFERERRAWDEEQTAIFADREAELDKTQRERDDDVTQRAATNILQDIGGGGRASEPSFSRMGITNPFGKDSSRTPAKGRGDTGADAVLHLGAYISKSAKHWYSFLFLGSACLSDSARFFEAIRSKFVSELNMKGLQVPQQHHKHNQQFQELMLDVQASAGLEPVRPSELRQIYLNSFRGEPGFKGKEILGALAIFLAMWPEAAIPELQERAEKIFVNLGYDTVDALPLTWLQSGTAPWTWGPEEEAAFAGLQRAIASAPVLKLLDPSADIYVFTDAFDFAVGG
ncbi:hypothetical protein HKX48_003288, partial [Thoreauomyces humboldtii]